MGVQCALPVCAPPCAQVHASFHIFELYIHGTEREGPNFALFLVLFSSFWKNRNRYSFVPFLGIVPECLVPLDVYNPLPMDRCGQGQFQLRSQAPYLSSAGLSLGSWGKPDVNRR